MKNILDLNSFIAEGRISPFYSDELNPDIWSRKESKGKTEWVLDEEVRKKIT